MDDKVGSALFTRSKVGVPTTAVDEGDTLGSRLAEANPVGSADMLNVKVGNIELVGNIFLDGTKVELVGARVNEGATDTPGS